MSKKPVEQVKRWVQHTNHTIKRSLSASTTSASGGSRFHGEGSFNKQWVHPPDVLQFGRVEYTVKFLGECEVALPKGTDVIKDAIQKIRFNLQLKRSETGISGAKLPKVEIQINVDGMTIVDSKTKMTIYKYPLHRISFCADDKQDKRVFSFIAKNGSDDNCHRCFVFLSDKLAEEITLTIGEAFDLAYRKFQENNGKDLEVKKQMILLRKRISELEQENSKLKQQLASQQRVESSQTLASNTIPSWENFDRATGLPPELPNTPVPKGPPPGVLAPIRPPQPTSRKSSTEAIMRQLTNNGPAVGTKLENLKLEEMDDLFDDAFDPRANEQNGTAKDPFGLEPFGINSMNNGNNMTANGQREQSKLNGESAEELENAISLIDSRLAEMREGFASGLTFGEGNDLLQDFDPFAANIAMSSGENGIETKPQ